MLEELTGASKVVGVKQVRRALSDGRAKQLFLAQDADPQITQPLAGEAGTRGVPVCWIPSMKALGRACGIAVGAAVAAIV